jgi:hypothetical protein
MSGFFRPIQTERMGFTVSINDLDLDKCYEDAALSSQCFTCRFYVPGERASRDSPGWLSSCEELEDKHQDVPEPVMMEVYSVYALLAEKGECEYYKERIRPKTKTRSTLRHHIDE